MRFEVMDHLPYIVHTINTMSNFMNNQSILRTGGASAFASLLASLLLTACGGGGGDDGGSVGGGGNPTAPVTGTVFAEASGALCAQRDASNICAEPTSSQASVAQLQALQENATGDRVRFNALGVEYDFYQAWGGLGSGLGVITSQASYRLLEQALVLGRQQVNEGGTVYAFSRVTDTANLEYTAGGENLFALGLLRGGGTPFAGLRNFIYEKTVGAGGSGSHGGRTWFTYFGPLTDRPDAPTDAEVQYTGVVNIHAGDGSPYTDTVRSSRVVWGGCEITLTLRTSTGTLSSPGASCTDPITKATITFTLAPLSVSASRVTGQLGNEASIRIEGPSGGNVSAPTTSVQFNSSQISGAVYGPGAAGIALVGSSPQGMFHVFAHRR